jgi:hypothetical protein
MSTVYEINPTLAQVLALNFPDIFIRQQQKNRIAVQEYVLPRSVAGEEMPVRGLPKSSNSTLIAHFMQKLVALDSEEDIVTALIYLKNYLTLAKKIDKLKEKIRVLDLQLGIGIIFSLIAYPAGACLYCIFSLVLASAIFPWIVCAIGISTALFLLASYASITRCFSAWSANKEAIQLHEQENQLDTWLAQTTYESNTASPTGNLISEDESNAPATSTSTVPTSHAPSTANQNSSSIAENPNTFFASAQTSEQNTFGQQNCLFRVSIF